MGRRGRAGARGGLAHAGVVTADEDAPRVSSLGGGENRWLYPIDWPELSCLIPLGHAKWRCERCGRPHGHDIMHLGNMG